MLRLLLIAIILSIILIISVESRRIASERHVKRLLKQLGRRHAALSRERNLADWNYGTNITDYNQQILLEKIQKVQKYDKYAWSLIKNFDPNDYEDEALRRQIERYSILGIAVLGDRAMEFTKLVTKMTKIYNEAKVCVKDKCDLSLDPDLTNLMANNRDWDTLSEAWVNWRDASGKLMRPMYDQYVKFANEMAVKNSDATHKFENYGDFLLEVYESKTIKEHFEEVWKELEPFYKELHAFIRMKLKKVYGNKMPKDGTMPAHVLGNMWAQSWTTLLRIVTPYPNAQIIDVGDAMVEQNYNATHIFKLSEQFFTGIGLHKMVDSFWTLSMLKKPTDRNVGCHPMSWDLSNGKDYRIRQCTEPTMEHLITAHHEMGHSEYFMSYKHQPFILREGANPGFHEAIGDTIALSVSTPKYLKSIGLLKEAQTSEEALINYQLRVALDKIAFLPFSYIIDLWRWDVFSGKITPENYNEKWWEYRLKYQGLSPPVKRTEEDFDPGAKFHVASDISYISYFVATFLQFQFHESLCKVAKEPVLYQCSIAGNKKAGAHLKRMLEYGVSIPWQRQLKEMTGSNKLSAKPILEYFKPLRDFLKKALKKEKIGWMINGAHTGYKSDASVENEEKDENKVSTSDEDEERTLNEDNSGDKSSDEEKERTSEDKSSDEDKERTSDVGASEDKNPDENFDERNSEKENAVENKDE